MRWLAFVAGLAILGYDALSVTGTLVVPRGIHSRLSRIVDRVVDAAFHSVTGRFRDFDHRDRFLAWQAPTTLLVRLVVWVILLVLGFTLVLLPFVPHGYYEAMSEAGSSVFTLGYSAPTNSSTTVIDYVAAYVGLIIVAVQIGYLPTLYAAFNRRETEVTLLISRAGLPAWGPELLARTRYGIGNVDVRPVLDELFDTWERWAAEVAESHTTYLTLVRLRSPRSLSHWLTSLLAVLDAAALHLAIAPSSEPRLRARLCLRMGFTAVQQIARAMQFPVTEEPDPDAPIALSFDEFSAAVGMLKALDYPVEVSAEEAWPHFRGWRVNYEGAALAIARAVDAPPALWSGERRWPSVPMPPLRPGNRLARDAAPRSYP